MELVKRLGLVTASLAIAFGLLEVLSRVVFPIQADLEIVGVDGGPVQLLEAGWPSPGIRYRMQTSEYDALVTHTASGHRGPMAPQDPDIVFLGDSFTFGQGLTDDETFAALYCQEAPQRCANLGWPGTGTAWHLDALAHQMDERGWRPQRVDLFMLAMTGHLGAGNDLLDNLRAADRKAPDAEPPGDAAAPAGEAPASVPAPAPGRSLKAAVLDQARWLADNSNFLRYVYYVAAPVLRQMLAAAPEGRRLEQALEATAEQLQRLDRMAEARGFTYRIFVLHPMHDLLRGSHEETVAALRAIAPDPQRVIATAPALLGDGSPERFYYRADGHFNAAGAQAIARFLRDADDGPATAAR